MIKRKGMTMAIQIVIVIIVLVVLALLVIGITRGQIFGGLGFLQKKGDQQDCLSTRDIFCQTEPDGCWDSSKTFIVKTSEEVAVDNQGTPCNAILGKVKEKSYYSCKYKTYLPSEAYPIFKTKAVTIDNLLNTDEGKTNLTEICNALGRYWDDQANTCNQSNGNTQTLDLTFLEKLYCSTTG